MTAKEQKDIVAGYCIQDKSGWMENMIWKTVLEIDATWQKQY